MAVLPFFEEAATGDVLSSRIQIDFGIKSDTILSYLLEIVTGNWIEVVLYIIYLYIIEKLRAFRETRFVVLRWNNWKESNIKFLRGEENKQKPLYEYFLKDGHHDFEKGCIIVTLFLTFMHRINMHHL